MGPQIKVFIWIEMIKMIQPQKGNEKLLLMDVVLQQKRETLKQPRL
jgi:hypothetical protein